MKTIEVGVVHEVDAREWASVAEGLRAEGRARLVVAGLSGGAISLGRSQDEARALSDEGRKKPVSRRPSGGRSIAVGGGVVAVALVMPHRSWLLSDRADELPAARLLNRGVRFLLDGLQRLGVRASYFGRDFISVDGGQGGYVSFDIGVNGHALIEAFIPVHAHWWPRDEWLASPPRPFGRGFPPPVMIEGLANRTVDDLSDALAAALSGLHGLTIDRRPVEVEPASVPAPTSGSSVIVDVEGSAVAAQAALRVADGRIEEAAILGEVLGDSAGATRLRTWLLGHRPEQELLARVLSETYSDPAHALLGIDDLGPVMDAFLRAAERAP